MNDIDTNLSLYIFLIIVFTLFSSSLSAQATQIDVAEGDVKISGKINVSFGFSNTYVGKGVGSSTDFGANNSAFGSNAGRFLTNGDRNSFFGAETGFNLSLGDDNSFFGFQAGINNSGSRNSIFGAGAGFGAIGGTGSNNVFYGYQSGESTVSGDNNTYIGYQAGRLNVSGDKNVFIGNFAGESELGSEKLYIANRSAADPLIYGDFATDELTIHGKLGIEIKQPVSELHILHAATHNNGATGLRLENTGANDNWWNFYTVNSNGNLILFSKAGGASSVGSFNDVSGVYTSTSDRRVKKNIENQDDVLDKVRSLNVKKYHFKTQSDEESKYLGLIAQDVLPLFPEMVSYNEETGRYSLDYASFSVVAIKAIQEQQKQIDNLTGLLKKLSAELQKLKISVDNFTVHDKK